MNPSHLFCRLAGGKFIFILAFYAMLNLDGAAAQPGNGGANTQTGMASLAKFVAGMDEKKWTEFPTIGINETLNTGNGTSVLDYCDGGAWDPVSKQVFLIGQGHGNAWKFVTYSAETNTWQQQQDPYWLSTYFRTHAVSHGYDHSAINLARRVFYHRPFSWPIVYQYKIDSKSWSALPAIPAFDQWRNCCAGIEYFPELGGLVVVSEGAVYFYDENRKAWQTLAQNLPMGSMHFFAEYNPVHKMLWFGGGNDDSPNGGAAGRKIYKLDSKGRISPLKSAPITLGILSSVQVAEPNSGKYLVVGNRRDFYAYDIIRDEWELLSNSAPFPMAYRTAAVSLTELGVVMFLNWSDASGGVGKVYLYKYKQGQPATPTADTIRVGQARQYKTPSEAAAVAGDGAVIEIDSGTYPGDVAVWTQNNLIIRGVGGGRAHLKANGAHAQGKGIWVIKGNNTTVENIEFSGATVPDQNGAGIRQEGSGLIVRNCYFHDNENGILGPNGGGVVLVEYSEFANNGYGDGFSHNIYILNAKRFTLRYSYMHHAKIGHNVKSRAQENFILYNRIMDEQSGTSSYAIDLPDGGTAFIIGNLVQQGPNTDNSTVISYGAESMSNSPNDLYIVNNTIVNDRHAGTFVFVNSSAKTVKLINNLFIGPGQILSGPGQQITNLATDNPGVADLAGFDYRLTKSSPAIDAGSNPGSANGVSLTPVFQYRHPTGREERPAQGALDIGAYEYVDRTTRVVEPENELLQGFRLDQNYPNPFNPETTIEFYLPSQAFVSLKVYALQGTEITTLIAKNYPAGQHRIKWDAAGTPSGIYLLRLTIGDKTLQRKLVLMK